MRVAINLLTDNPDHPSGAHWFWTRVIPEMAKRLVGDEEFQLVVSPRMRPLHEGYGPNVSYLTFPWSNERQKLRTLSEHALTPFLLRRAGTDIFSTLIAPAVKPAPALVAHFKTLHAYTAPGALRPAARIYRQLTYPHTVKVADAIIINSESLRDEVNRYLDVDPAKLHLIPEAVDHELFRPGDRDEAWEAVRTHGVSRPFVLFVSSLWAYKNCEGVIRAFAQARAQLGDRQLVIVGSGRDEEYVGRLKVLTDELGLADHIVWVGGIPLESTVAFYRSADVFVYPSFNETFGLPILEAMACGCPVVTSSVSSMPETAGGAALLADPHHPESIGAAIVEACGPAEERLRAAGPVRAAMFNWATTAERTLDVYRAVHAAMQRRRKSM
jgi:glycosyltransferase involved in cell wall biosynthesis